MVMFSMFDIHIFQILPFGYTIVMVRMRGRYIKKLLEHSLALTHQKNYTTGEGSAIGTGRFLAFSSMLRYRFNPLKEIEATLTANHNVNPV